MSDVSKTNEALIAEAQEHYSEMNGLNSRAAEVMMELVAALEAKTGVRVDMSSATRVPVQGEPNDELANEALIAEARKAERAVYLATEEAVAKDISRIIKGLADALAARVPVQGEPNDELAKVEAELAEWVAGKRSWCDQHHGLLNQFELTAKADDAQIRLLMTRRDALRTEAQGEPNDDREALARALYIASDDFAFADRQAKAWDAPGPHGRQRWYRYADAVVAAGFSRATVPDAATTETFAERMERKHGALAHLKGLLADAETERDAATTAIAEVRALHRREPGTGVDWCSHCIDNDGPWPCSTIAALDGAPEPEWEESK